jgi:hypothetical protein
LEVATALLEREKLWPDDSPALEEVAKDFEELAAAVGRGREQLSTEEQAERQRYLDHAHWLKRAADAGKQAGSRPSAATEGAQH